jgi:hypothetical protein
MGPDAARKSQPPRAGAATGKRASTPSAALARSSVLDAWRDSKGVFFLWELATIAGAVAGILLAPYLFRVVGLFVTPVAALLGLHLAAAFGQSKVAQRYTTQTWLKKWTATSAIGSFAGGLIGTEGFESFYNDNFTVSWVLGGILVALLQAVVIARMRLRGARWWIFTALPWLGFGAAMSDPDPGAALFCGVIWVVTTGLGFMWIVHVNRSSTPGRST